MLNCLSSKVDDFQPQNTSTADIWNMFSEFNTVDDQENSDSDDENCLQLNYGCEECKTYTLVYQDGQHVCSNCGLVQQKKLSHEAEYRFYGDSDNKSNNPERVGLPSNYMLPESSLGTMITHRSFDKQSIKRMVQYNTWSQMPYKERSLYKTCCNISQKCNAHGLPPLIIHRGQELYNTIKDVNISRGDNRDGLIAACVYYACKDDNVPRSKKEIAEIFGIELKDMTIGLKNFRGNWRQSEKHGDRLKTECTNPIDFIERYCSNLPIDKNIKHISEVIAIKAIFKNLVDDNTAPSIAAGAIFLACSVTGQNISKKQVAEACKTSEVTISKCYKKLNDKRLMLLPKDIIRQYNL